MPTGKENLKVLPPVIDQGGLTRGVSVSVSVGLDPDLKKKIELMRKRREKKVVVRKSRKPPEKIQKEKSPGKTGTIMADFGWGPYAWLKDATDTTDSVGLNIANCNTGMTEFIISKSLERDFAEWIGLFERNALRSDGLDWELFNKEGIRLSRRLKREIGILANVVYVKPAEDPGHQVKEKTWIEVVRKGKAPVAVDLVTFKELIAKYEWNSVRLAFQRIYPDQKKNLRGYKQVFSELQNLKPKKTKMKIVVKEEVDALGNERYVPVSGKDGSLKKENCPGHLIDDEMGNEEETFALQYTSWEKWGRCLF